MLSGPRDLLNSTRSGNEKLLLKIQVLNTTQHFKLMCTMNTFGCIIQSPLTTAILECMHASISSIPFPQLHRVK